MRPAPPFSSAHGGIFPSDHFDSELRSVLAAYFPNACVTQQGCSNAEKTKLFCTSLSLLLQLSKILTASSSAACREPAALLYALYWFSGKKYPCQTTLHFKTLIEEVQRELRVTVLPPRFLESSRSLQQHRGSQCLWSIPRHFSSDLFDTQRHISTAWQGFT